MLKYTLVFQIKMPSKIRSKKEHTSCIVNKIYPHLKMIQYKACTPYYLIQEDLNDIDIDNYIFEFGSIYYIKNIIQRTLYKLKLIMNYTTIDGIGMQKCFIMLNDYYPIKDKESFDQVNESIFDDYVL